MTKQHPSVSYAPLYELLQVRSGLPPYHNTDHPDGYTTAMLAEECGRIVRSTAARWGRLNRIPWDRADECAVALGLTPRAIWKGEWDDLMRSLRAKDSDEENPEPGVWAMPE